MSAADSDDTRERLACTATDCSYVHYDNPTPVVAAIVQREDSVVLVQNKGWPGSFFGLMSGFLERNEHPDEAVARELHEELGLVPLSQTFLGHYAFDGMNQLILAYHMVVEGEWTLGREIAAAKAIPIAKLRAWSVGTGPALQDWLVRVRGH